MFAAVAPFFILFAAASLYARADPSPNNPGPGDVFIEGRSCMIGWDVDLTGVWKTMNIDLMTGDNFDMIFLTTVATVDGINPSRNIFSFACPQVTPHAPIYFYQFSSPATPNKTWTGRFTITDSANDIVAPSQSTQPGGAKIPWGAGSLVGKSSSATPSASGLASSTSGTLTYTSLSATHGSPLVSASSLSMSPRSANNPTTNDATTTLSTFSAMHPKNAVFAAALTLSVPSTVFQAGLALGLAAFGFAAVF